MHNSLLGLYTTAMSHYPKQLFTSLHAEESLQPQQIKSALSMPWLLKISLPALGTLQCVAARQKEWGSGVPAQNSDTSAESLPLTLLKFGLSSNQEEKKKYYNTSVFWLIANKTRQICSLFIFLFPFDCFNPPCTGIHLLHSL